MTPTNVLLIGGAVADVSLCPVDSSIFSRPSTPVDHITMSTGGDALNEATVLAQLGDNVRLVTLLGKDPAGQHLLTQCRRAGIDCSTVIQTQKTDTSINVVLVDQDGERRFVTAKNSSLRQLAPKHVQPALDHLENIQIACFASIFVSPHFGSKELEALFRSLKERRILVCADMTRPKNGETAEDLRGALQYVDFFFPNLEEGQLLTGESAPKAVADRLLALGVKNVVLKLGKDGCLICYDNLVHHIPAYPDSRCLDTTGAGDTFAGGFLHGLLWGMPRHLCAQFANAAASICIEHIGCASGALSLREIERRMERIVPTRS